MRTRMFLLASIVAVNAAATRVETAAAQGMQGMMPRGTDQQAADHGTMGGGAGNSMMCPMMRSGMMQGGMMGSSMMGGGMGALFGSRVAPVMNLSVDDVRGYLVAQLDRLKNKRLKVGSINSADGTITADIVTVDNSLVQQLKVDRHSGAITYED